MSRPAVSRDFGSLVLLFLGIPLLVLSVIGGQMASRFQEEEDRTRASEQEFQLDRLVGQTTEIAWGLDRLTPFQRILERRFDDPAAVERAREALKKQGFDLTVYLFRDSRLVRSHPASTIHEKLFSDLYAGIGFEGERLAETQRRLKKPILDLLGPGHRPELLKRYPGRLSIFKQRNGKGGYLYRTLRDGRGWFIFVPTYPGFITRAKVTLGGRHPENGVGLPALNRWIPPAGISSRTMLLAWSLSEREGGQPVHLGDRTWRFASGRNGEVWCRATRAFAWKAPGPLQLAIGFGYLTSIFFIGLYLLQKMGLEACTSLILRFDRLSLASRFTLFFSTASLVPLGVGILLGALALQDRGEILRADAARQSLERISFLESVHEPHLERLTQLSKRLRNAPWVQDVLHSTISQTISHLIRIDAIQRFEIRDPHGEVLFSTDDPEVHGTSLAQALFSRTAIRRLIPHRLGRDSEKVSADDLLGESILSSDELGMASLLRKPNSLWTFHMGTGSALWYYDVFGDLATGPAFIAVTHQLEWIYERAIRQHIQASLKTDPPRKRFSPLGRETPFQASLHIDPKTSRLTLNPLLSISGTRELIAAALRSSQTGRVIFRELRLGDETWWATCKPEETVNTFVLIDLVPTSGPLASLDPIRKRLAMGVFLAVLLSLLAAHSLAALFLMPINDLAEGIDAIRRRDAKFRVPVRRRDEFGALAMAFNRALGDLQELEYGRIVQESLLPDNPDIPPGYRISWLRKPAADLAGDYHDIIRTEQGDYIILLGDVTGHGLPAALAMAMAKATVVYRAVAGWALPGGLMERLNALFYRELKPRNKFMTLGCVRLDPRTHSLDYENAGHPYLLIFQESTGEVRELALPSMPLGSRPKRRPGSQTVELAPGDAFLLYSDGFVECPDRDGNMFGYPRLLSLYRDIMRQGVGPDEALKKMIEVLDGTREPGPLPDDLTLLLVQRDPQGGANKTE